MSDPAHVVISFGKCHIELYRRRDGSLCGVGPLLLNAIRDAMSCDHYDVTQRHPGGRIIKSLIGNTTEIMSAMNASTKLRGSVKDDFQFCMGTEGESWNNGYFIQFFPQEDESAWVENKGKWLISYCEELEGHETLDDWLPKAQKYSLDEFEKTIYERCAATAANDG